MTLKQFKARFVPGLTVHHVRNMMGPVGVNRVVDAVQGNGVWMRDEGKPDGPRWWFEFPKASNLTATEEGFTMHFPATGPNDHDKVSEYLWQAPTTGV